MTHLDLPGRSNIAGWLPLVCCCLGTFLLLLYTSIVTVAAPGIAARIGAVFSTQQWIIDSYSLAMAGLMLGAGAVCDAYGYRRCYSIGVAGFTGATMACGLAPTAGVLVAARTAQGISGAAMFGAIIPLIGLIYTEPRQRASAFAIWGAVAGAASAIGTAGGGILIQYVDWRWMFLGALPVCALTLVLARRTLPHDAGAASSRRTADRQESAHDRGLVDWAGIALATLTVTALAYALIAAGESGWLQPVPLTGVAVAGAACVALFAVERSAPRPVLPTALIRRPRFSAVLLVAFGYYFATFGILPSVARWLQAAGGMSPSATSVLLIVQLVFFVTISAILGGRLHGIRRSWTLGGASFMIGAAALTGTVVYFSQTWQSLLPFLILSGVGAGIISPILPAAAMASAPAHYAGTASSAANAARQLGLTLGIAVCGTLTSHGATTGAVSRAFLISAMVAVLTGFIALVLLVRAETFDPPRQDLP